MTGFPRERETVQKLIIRFVNISSPTGGGLARKDSDLSEYALTPKVWGLIQRNASGATEQFKSPIEIPY